MTAGRGRVERFRSVEEMNAAKPALSSTESFDRFLRHCARYRRLAGRRYPRGVFKFRSIEEAQRARDLVTAGSNRPPPDAAGEH